MSLLSTSTAINLLRYNFSVVTGMPSRTLNVAGVDIPDARSADGLLTLHISYLSISRGKLMLQGNPKAWIDMDELEEIERDYGTIVVLLWA